MESFPSGDLGGRLLVAAYGAVSLHHWCQRLLRLSSVTDECHFYLDILTKIIGESTVVTEEGQLRVHERRRIALKQRLGIPASFGLKWSASFGLPL